MSSPTILRGALSSDSLLSDLADQTKLLSIKPYEPLFYIQRANTYSALQYPDLAAGDAYRALMLYEAAVDDTSEAAEWIVWAQEAAEEKGTESPEMPTKEAYDTNMPGVMRLLVRSLMQCGCLRDAYEFWKQAIAEHEMLKEDDEMKAIGNSICWSTGGSSNNSPRRSNDGSSEDEESHRVIVNEMKDMDVRVEDVVEEVDIAPSQLPAQGTARRELYPWNDHEPDRASQEVLSFLNQKMQEIAPKVEVRSTRLPNLRGIADAGDVKAGKVAEDDDAPATILQLGLFAKEDMEPGEIILRETTLLTSTNRVHDDNCDACNGPLPELSSENPPVACEDCHDTIFCSQKCHDDAQTFYHPAVCGAEDLDTIGKDVPDPKDLADNLYLLLLGRAFALAETQKIHPLDLPEVKYIWGDFHPYSSHRIPVTYSHERIHPASATLPFSFHLNIVQPIRLLTAMEIDPFANLDRYDTWILNSLYAKFRGTASGRLSTWDGGPEVCAVHPLWCLGNHSCDPNVKWEWGGEISFTVRPVRISWGPSKVPRKGGIKAGEEIRGYYCDVNQNVRQRRDWAVGALGGECMCERCVWEAMALGTTGLDEFVELSWNAGDKRSTEAEKTMREKDGRGNVSDSEIEEGVMESDDHDLL